MLLGSLFVSPEVLARLKTFIGPADFYRGNHGAIYQAILELDRCEQPIDVFTVSAELSDQGVLEESGGRPYLLQIQEGIPTSAHWEYYAERVADRSTRRRLIRAADQIMTLARDESEELAAVLDRSAEGLLGASRHRAGFQKTEPVSLSRGDELLTKTIARPRWTVEKIMPEGLCFLFGRPKMRKSWLALSLAVAVALGGHALGYFPVERRGVAYLALEDAEWRLQERLGLLVPEGSVFDQFYYETKWQRFDQGGGTKLREFLAANPQIGLVIVDTYAKVSPRQVTGVSVYQQDYEAGAYFKAIADEFHVCLLVIHHSRKAAAEDWLDTINASTGLAGAADTVMLLETTRGESSARLRVTGRDVETEDYHLEWSNASCAWSVEGKAAEFARTKERAEILTAMKSLGGVGNPKAIAIAIGKSRDNVKMLLRKMAGDGEILSDGEGTYWLRAPS